MSKDGNERMAAKRIWFAAHALFYFKLKKGKQTTFTVMENVYLVHARNGNEARSRAEALAQAEAVADDSLTVDGKPAVMVFAGLRKILWCAADPSRPGGPEVEKVYDGIEATYSTFTVQGRRELKALLEGKRATVAYEADLPNRP